MKKLFFLLCSVAFISAQAQTVDEIIQKYTTAAGGLDAFNNVKTVKLTGILTTQGMDLPLTIQMINGQSTRTDVEAMGQSVTNVYSKGSGWKINPFAGAPTATDVTGQELSDLKAQASFASPLMDYKARGSQVSLEGKETIEGVPTYKVKLISKEDGSVSNYFINQSDYSLVKLTATREMQGTPTEIETFFSENKEISGLKLSMMRIQKMAGETFQQLHFDKIEFNIPVDDKIFNKP